MSVARPMCAVCHARPREEGTAKCSDCGPGRLATYRPPKPTTSTDKDYSHD